MEILGYYSMWQGPGVDCHVGVDRYAVNYSRVWVNLIDWGESVGRTQSSGASGSGYPSQRVSHV
ncbi:hypothetical protein BGX38DRAFT_1235607 [Terfezia claveryi]|nr:hypothetical protein BGX38DRAFT_1235607 [Terfezia claveryi]